MRWTALLALFAAHSLGALSVDPWFGNVYEFESKLDYSHIWNHRHQASVGKVGIGFMPDAAWAVELEAQGCYPVAKAQIRHLWLNDCAGDRVSLTGGVSAATISRRALNQPLFLYHSHFETEGHLSCGKEFGFHKSGFFRAWGAAVGGIGASSSAWGRVLLSLDALLKEGHKISCTLEQGKGFGNSHSHHTFAHTHYRYTDLLLGYQFNKIGYGALSAGYKRRLAAHRCPHHVNTIELEINIPFSF